MASLQNHVKRAILNSADSLRSSIWHRKAETIYAHEVRMQMDSSWSDEIPFRREFKHTLEGIFAVLRLEKKLKALRRLRHVGHR